MNDENIKLSIIIPMYNTYAYTKRLLCELISQLTDEVELIVVDDSTDGKSYDLGIKYPKIRYIKNDCNRGVSYSRNVGINESRGKYISFIDSDDFVSHDYISKILAKIKSTDFDYCFISWKWFGIIDENIVITDVCPDWNWAVWNRIWNKDFIGVVRFNEDRNIAEDAEFIMNTIGSQHDSKYKKENIVDVLYHYRTGRGDSLSDLFGNGKLTEFR